MATKNSLKIYRQRRNVRSSGEPRGGQEKSHTKPTFVIQKHAASHLHYDFRLEIGGVLVSWAIPKGPSLDPSVKRLAVRTDDHPLEYGHFEGIIPPGNYGAGQVIIWDRGTYKNLKDDSLEKCLKRGTLEVELNGKKLKGAFALVRTHFEGKEQWLFFKMKDKHASSKKDLVAKQPASVKSGKTIEDLKGQKKVKTWQSNHKKEPSKLELLLADDKDDDPVINVGKYQVNITHPDRVVGKKPKILKQDIINYYINILPYMLPLSKNRLLVMQRFPDGLDEKGFYQKEASEYFPSWIKRVAVSHESGVVHYVEITNGADIVYLANQNCIVFHRWLSKPKKLNYPDLLIFDFDPSGTNFNDVRHAALNAKKLLESLGLTPYAMITGSRGIHVVVPLKTQDTFDEVKDFAYDVARYMVRQDPEHLTLEMRKDKRDGKIFVDYLRNALGATAVAPYSVRARAGAPVATPITWQEVAKKTLKPDQWNIKNIFKRLNRNEDPWSNMHKHAQLLKKARKRLDTLLKDD